MRWGVKTPDPQTKELRVLLPRNKAPPLRASPGVGPRAGGGGEGLAQQALSRFIAIKWGPRAAPPED